MWRIFRGRAGKAVRMHNLRAILLALLRYGNLSRMRLAQMTGLSNTTITNLTAELLRQGVVIEDDEPRPAAPPRRRRAGRPQTGLRLVPGARYAVGVQFDVDQVNVALMDLHARALQTRSLPGALGQSPEALLNETGALIREMIASSGVNPRRVLGIGIGASGLVDPQTGVNVFAPNLGWRDVPMRDWLSRALGMPVVVENNVRAMALAETLFGVGRDSSSLAFIYSRVGVGAGFVVNGQLYRGGDGGAGEIGHTTIIPYGGERCSCGNTGCLETLVSEPAILRAADRLAETDPALRDALANPAGAPIERVFSAAEAGSAAACGLLEERAGYLGLALANLVNTVNPELLVFGGIFAQGERYFLPVAERIVRERAFAGLGSRVTFRTTSFDGTAGVTGAAALALNQFFYQREPA
jgi:predicted NBD/HSP70 family sugar kinase